MLGLLAMNEGDDRAAEEHLREALARSASRLPAAHNNLGVVLARTGRLREAEREFGLAVKKADGRFEEAAHNLSVCRALQSSEAAKAQLASLKTVETAAGARK